MDVLTSAADAILSEDSENQIILTPMKNLARPVMRDLTNRQMHFTSNKNFSSTINSLLNEKITCSNLSLPKPNFRTPGKWRKNSQKFSDENQAPSPKTPKNEEKNISFDESPITPLSNLKMLTRIASMEEHIPSKKTLFDIDPGVTKSKLGLRRCMSENINVQRECVKEEPKSRLKKHPTSSDLDHPILKSNKSKNFGAVSESSRREKSLGLLCERFLDHFPIEVSCLETPRRLVIDDVASSLGTERRRVYDIVNVLECLNMASRVQKNMYQWMGKQHLESTLSRLKGLAEEWGIGEYLSSPLPKSVGETKIGKCGGAPPFLVEKVEARKEKSIGILCQKFLMLFLSSQPPHVIQLETAIQLLLGQEGDDLEKLRTRGRRIYDIANVLVALRLIRKLPQLKSFMYIGPIVESVKNGVPDGGYVQQQIKLRHSLLPPPLTETHSPPTSEDSFITPSGGSSENEENLPRKGKPRKLASEFSKSKAKRNCLSIQMKPEECPSPPSVQKKSTIIRDLCKGFEVEKKKIMNCPREVEESWRKDKVIADTSLKIQNYGKPFRISHFSSPRMALTFDDPSMTRRSPPPITNRPCIPGASSTSNVVVRTPFIVRRVSLPNGSFPQQENDGRKLFIIRSTPNTPQNLNNSPQNLINPISKVTNPLQNLTNPSDKSVSSFKVYSRSPSEKTISLHGKSKPSDLANPLPSFVIDKKINHEPEKQVIKSFSQVPLPSITNPVSSSVISDNKIHQQTQKRIVKSLSQIALPSITNPDSSSVIKDNKINHNTQKRMVKSLSQTALPNISLNTLSRSHYKTVFGSSSQIPGRRLSSPTNKGSYHFVINSSNKKSTSCERVDREKGVKRDILLSKENKQPSFVKMLETSSDNSSTDSELESIFGDSFHFTRPKTLVKKFS